MFSGINLKLPTNVRAHEINWPEKEVNLSLEEKPYAVEFLYQKLLEGAKNNGLRKEMSNPSG